MMTLLVRNGDQRLEPADCGRLAAVLADPACTLWLDIQAPNAAEIQVLSDVFHFHPLTIEDATNDVYDPPKVEDYGEYLFIICHAVRFDSSKEDMVTTELDLYLGKNYVVTVHQQELPELDDVRLNCQRGLPFVVKGPDWLAHAIMDDLVDKVLPVVGAVDEEMAMLEECALQAPDPALVQRISGLKRSIMRLRWLVAPQRELMGRMARGDFGHLVAASTQPYFRDVFDHLVRLDSMIEDLRDLSESVMGIHLATQNNRLNEIMKTLGIVGVIFLPLTLVASVFGTNFDETYMPSGWIGFGLMCGSFMVSVGIMLALFKRRGWI